MRLDILYFLGYDIDEPLPWHSTISRTRQLFPESVFEDVFVHVLSMCVVKGSTQAIDGAPVKANASMDTLELKVAEQDLDAHLAEIRHISHRDKEAFRKAKENKASKTQQTVIASTQELQAITNRNANWKKNQTHRPGANNKGSRYTSNKTHYSPTDPDAQISLKPGKVMKGKYQNTVEPVFGTLTQFIRLRKINTIGIKQANKVMHLSAVAYNLKKYLKFVQKQVKSEANSLLHSFLKNYYFLKAISLDIKTQKINVCIH